MLFTTTALQHNIITQQEADSLERWIDQAIMPSQVSTVPHELLPIFNKVSLFRAEGNLNG